MIGGKGTWAIRTLIGFDKLAIEVSCGIIRLVRDRSTVDDVQPVLRDAGMQAQGAPGTWGLAHAVVKSKAA